MSIGRFVALVPAFLLAFCSFDRVSADNVYELSRDALDRDLNN
jgi:hypothetical protein